VKNIVENILREENTPIICTFVIYI